MRAFLSRRKGTCLGTAQRVWTLDFLQERCLTTSPGDFEGHLLALGTVRQGGLRVEEATGEPRQGCCTQLAGMSEKRGPCRQNQGVGPDKAASLLGPPEFRRGPGWVAPLGGASSPCAQVTGLVPSQGTYRKEPTNV